MRGFIAGALLVGLVTWVAGARAGDEAGISARSLQRARVQVRLAILKSGAERAETQSFAIKRRAQEESRKLTTEERAEADRLHSVFEEARDLFAALQQLQADLYAHMVADGDEAARVPDFPKPEGK